jgi:hypothetical protein
VTYLSLVTYYLLLVTITRDFGEFGYIACNNMQGQNVPGHKRIVETSSSKW